jgi:glutaredoxin
LVREREVQQQKLATNTTEKRETTEDKENYRGQVDFPYSTHIYNKDNMGRICSDCKKEKTLGEFYRWKNDPIHNRRYICIVCESMRGKKYRENNVEKEKIRRRTKYLKNREREIAKDNEYKKKRMLNDPSFKMLRGVRDRHSKAVKRAGKLKNFRTTDLLGCDSKTLKEHFESLFKPDMSWDNYNTVWHIDHIYPLSKVNWDDLEQVSYVCNYKNLLPQYKEVNWSKGCKLNFY